VITLLFLDAEEKRRLKRRGNGGLQPSGACVLHLVKASQSHSLLQAPADSRCFYSPESRQGTNASVVKESTVGRLKPSHIYTWTHSVSDWTEERRKKVTQLDSSYDSYMSVLSANPHIGNKCREDMRARRHARVPGQFTM